MQLFINILTYVIQFGFKRNLALNGKQNHIRPDEFFPES